jgi:hypothetical protein
MCEKVFIFSSQSKYFPNLGISHMQCSVKRLVTLGGVRAEAPRCLLARYGGPALPSVGAQIAVKLVANSSETRRRGLPGECTNFDDELRPGCCRKVGEFGEKDALG